MLLAVVLAAARRARRSNQADVLEVIAVELDRAAAELRQAAGVVDFDGDAAAFGAVVAGGLLVE